MPVAVAEIVKQLGIFGSGGFAFKIFPIADKNRVGGIVVCHKSLLYEHAGHAVGSSRHYIMVVKAQVGGRSRQRGVPVLCAGFIAKTEMPFADCCGCVASASKHVGKSELLRAYYHAGVAGCYIGAGSSPGVFAGQKRVARGCACCRYSMGVGKTDAVACKPVDSRGRYVFGTVAFKVAVTEVVGYNHNHIRFGVGSFCSGYESACHEEGEIAIGHNDELLWYYIKVLSQSDLRNALRRRCWRRSKYCHCSCTLALSSSSRLLSAHLYPFFLKTGMRSANSSAFTPLL